MDKPLNKTAVMLGNLLRRDWKLLVVWLLGVLAFAASGAGKFEVAMGTAQLKATMYTLFQNPAMVALFGPSNATVDTATIATVFGQTMSLLTSLTFAIVSIIYVIDRTRKEEDEGITELLRSLQVGKLARTTAVVIELVALEALITLTLAASIQVQHVTSMTNFPENLLFAATVGAQGLLWGIVALVFAQIFSDSGSAKAVTFSLLGVLYIVRMGTDISNVNLGWFNPLSWSYLTWVYVSNNWLPVAATLILSAILLTVAYLLEINRDVSAGYLNPRDGKAHASTMLLSLPGLVFRESRGMIIGWSIGLFVAGIMYGSMFGQMASFLNNSTGIMQQLLSVPGYQASLVNQYVVTIFSLGGVAISCFGAILFGKMVSEERKNRQEQLYATHTSRYSMFATYLALALFGTAIGQFLFGCGMWLAQLHDANPFSFGTMMGSGFVYLPAIWFVLGLLSVIAAFMPRFTGLIWIYLGFAFLMSYIGKILSLPDWVNNISVFHSIPAIPVASMSWGPTALITTLSLVLMAIGLFQYRRRDLING